MYVEDFGFPYPVPLHGRDAMPRVFLPASKTVKDIHAEHVVSCLANDDKVRVAGIVNCEKDRQSVSSAVGNLEKNHI